MHFKKVWIADNTARLIVEFKPFLDLLKHINHLFNFYRMYGIT